MSELVALVHNPDLCYSDDYLYDTKNPIYRAVETLFIRLGLDATRVGTEDWNPLGELIHPGQRVVIKPNFVASRDRERVLADQELLCSSTSPAVLHPILEYTLKALRGDGHVAIVDSPIEGSDFEQTVKRLRVPDLIMRLAGQTPVPIELIDLRDFVMAPHMLLDNAVVGKRSINIGFLRKEPRPGDPLGYVVMDLGTESAFAHEFSNHADLRFHRSNPRTPVPHHSPIVNRYSFSKTVLSSDVLIHVPKLKTHKKAGVTLAMKSVIGLSNRKYWMPHYQAGWPPHGDEYPVKPSLGDRVFLKLSRFPMPGGHSLILNFPKTMGHRPIADGSWPGNDTLWRTILDLNRALLYASADGRLHSTPQRQILVVIDGIVGGEGDGPIRPVPKQCGVLVGGLDPAAVDWVATTIMGLDPSQIRFLRDVPMVEIKPESLAALRLNFTPPLGWEGLAR
jgi:uncharacterized protein (DUF362 family)